MPQLGTFGTQKLAPRRHVVEQLAHFHGGAGCLRLGYHFAQLAAFHLQGRAMFVTGPARSQRETADRGDGWQCFTSESQGGHRFKIIERSDLAGCVAGNRQRQLLRGNAATVIADADQADAALFQVDIDAQRAGIQCVLDQFLDHGRGTFNDFARGDLVDEGIGELADLHGEAALRRPVKAAVMIAEGGGFMVRRHCRWKWTGWLQPPAHALRTGCPVVAGG